MIRQSINKRAYPVTSLEVIVDGTKFLGRINTKKGVFHVMKGDKVIIVRRKRMLRPTL